MSGSSEKNLLRFGCPACGIRLVVDRAIAGTQGPCPSCGAIIVAPPLEVSDTLVKKEAAPLAVKPRSMSKKQLENPSSGQVDQGPDRTPFAPGPESVGKSGRSAGPGRAVSPSTVLSQEHEEKKDTKTLLMMVMVTVLVLCIALGVYYYMVYGQ